ncbi:COMM domain-containing protein 8-like [Corticium candelabrum]|uniref:COMM domain-containing protein 8-like n=1 Tax=Corticium candelabrum TaxID=121492 RepID=UPI002E2634D6|nr:COMM domain-containing protein 8-like [Corticium candelabrum]
MEQLQILKKFSTDQFEKLFHESCDFICGRQGPRYKDYGKILKIDKWQAFETAFIKLVKDAALDDKNKSRMSESFPDNHLQVFQDSLAARRQEIIDAMKISATTVGHAQLKDFDWNLRLILSSDKIAVVSEPVVTVDFKVEDCGGESKQVSLEMNRDELKKILSSLEAANKVVQQLKA